VRRPIARGSAPKAKKAENGDITPTPSVPQAPHNEVAQQPSAAAVRNALLARAVLEAGVSPEPQFACWLYRDPASGLLAVRVIYLEELAVAPFPEPWGRA